MLNPQSVLYNAFDKPPEPVIAFLQWLVDSYGVTCPPRVLDVGCGPGRMLREFARLGWQSVGLEPDEDFFREATAFDRASAPVEAVRRGGFNDIDDVSAFDLVASINGPFSYLLKLDTRLDAVRRMYRALRPQGILFLEIANFPWLLKNFEEFREQAVPHNGQSARRIQHYRVDFHSHTWVQIDEFQYTDPVEGPIRITKEHECAIITLPELRYFLQQAGFTAIRTYNGYDSRQDEPLTGHDLLISAQKAG